MKRRLVALAAALGLAVPAGAAVAVKPYGFILANYMENWGRPNAIDIPASAVSASNAAPPNQNTSDFTARQTRLGLDLSGGEGPWGSKLAGKVEIDFYGLRNAGAAGFDVLASAPRMRLAFVKASRGAQSVVFGQDWVTAFAPLSPTSLSHMASSALAGSGNLYNRLPQLRWDADWALGGPWSARTSVAVVRSFSADEAGRTSGTATNATAADLAGSGEFSGGPAYQALVELRREIAGRLWRVGASMQYLRESFNASVPAPTGATNSRVEGLIGSAHFVLPVLSRLTLSGEGFYGHSDQNVNGIGQVYDDNGIVRTSQARGGFVQAEVKPAQKWRLHAYAGFESIDELGLAAGSEYRNETVGINAMWDVSPEMTLALEFGRIHTYYVGALSGENKNAGLSAQYKF
ncbi:MAG: hypothetical protein KGM24_07065 [Elusimicrobia bacterium]|nr:hypothetical protein [Elusimicrobiota bacterium]